MSKTSYREVPASPSDSELTSLGRWATYFQTQGYRIAKVENKRVEGIRISSDSQGETDFLEVGRCLHGFLAQEQKIALIKEDHFVYLVLEQISLLDRLFNKIFGGYDPTR
ncbi:MAG: hypothetical protein CEO12_589 [Parcubacteria group bacterium Gr01-1014_46]|nr:MAG: hypothetical protein CEO12_589 [Parcubacteria group bacterium Gr01-1014_46]